MIQLKILNKEFFNEYDLPSYATEGAAGIDLRSPHSLVLYPSERARLPLGFAIWLQDIIKQKKGNIIFNLSGLILPRSSLGKQGLVLANTVGLIDSDYQGELVLELWNSGNEKLEISRGDRVAQLVLIPTLAKKFTKHEMAVVTDFAMKTDRGDGGFGSTGLN